MTYKYNNIILLFPKKQIKGKKGNIYMCYLGNTFFVPYAIKNDTLISYGGFEKDGEFSRTIQDIREMDYSKRH